MQLSYRGVKYEYTPPVVETKLTDEVGKFRGLDIRFRTITKAPVQQPTLDLMYRGIPYRTGQTAAPVVESTVAAPAAAKAVVPSAVAAEDRARMMLMNHHRIVKRRQQSMLSRLATEVGMPANAAQHWNHIQGKVHPSFWATYDRGHASAS
ncbi:MAG TPA: DUF4278 domain-containing protein [Trichocoleus sp.]